MEGVLVLLRNFVQGSRINALALLPIFFLSLRAFHPNKEISQAVSVQLLRKHQDASSTAQARLWTACKSCGPVVSNQGAVDRCKCDVSFCISIEFGPIFFYLELPPMDFPKLLL